MIKAQFRFFDCRGPVPKIQLNCKYAIYTTLDHPPWSCGDWIAAGIAVVIITVVQGTGTNLSTMFGTISTAIK
jgi:hypothetical protein